jgi:hypothetical protein
MDTFGRWLKQNCNPKRTFYFISSGVRAKSNVGNILAKAAALRIIDGKPIASKSQLPITLFNLSSINLVVYIFGCSSPPHNPVYVRCVDPSALAFSLSSHRHSWISLLFGSRFIE